MSKAKENDEKPIIENEALKNTEDVFEDKKVKEPVSDEDLPGYPHYAPNEDILSPDSNMKRVTADVENITRTRDLADGNVGRAPAIPPVNDMEVPMDEDLSDDFADDIGKSPSNPTVNNIEAPTDDYDDLGIVAGTEADVTKEDLILLGPKDQDMDMGEDEELLNKGFPLAMTGEDLDVPGDDPEDESDSLGQGDEENDYYSLGGDAHENLEEDPSGNL